MPFYDLLIIGGGPGGYVAASYATQFGKKVALIEKNRLGGCCLNVGCIPTKIILEAAERYSIANGSEQYGVKGSEHAFFDWKTYKAFSDKIVANLCAGVGKLLKSRKVDVIYGEAAIINDENSYNSYGQIKVGGQLFEAQNVIIATGSRPAIPEQFSRLNGVLTSDSFWTLEEQPHSIVIVGGGVIGCEIASALSRLGTEVTIIEQMTQILPEFSADATTLLKAELERCGVKIYCDKTVSDIRYQDDKGFEVLFEDKKIPCDYVLWATGRRPVVPAGIDDVHLTKEGFISVDENLRTDIDGIYCIGDANGKTLLAHAAINQAMAVVKHICSGEKVESDAKIPTTVFTEPAIARIGEYTQGREMTNSGQLAIGTVPYNYVGYGHVTSHEQGYFKIFRDIKTDVIIGAEIVGHNACELIHVLAPYIDKKLSSRMFADVIFAHPTLSEGIKMAVEASYTGSPQV